MNYLRSIISLLLLPTVAILGAFMLFAVTPMLKTGGGRSPGSGGPVLVELFTSEGCSSCPPADQLLLELEQSPGIGSAPVIVLSEHVDYWNRLGWVDPFSSARFSDRQKLYASRSRGGGIYTPQMVVDGREELVGSDRGRALQAIGAAASEPKAAVTIARRQAGRTEAMPLEVSIEKVPSVPAGETVDAFLAITEGALSSNVSRGENAGRRLEHTAVVRSLTAIGNLPAGKTSFHAQPDVRIAPDWKTDHLNAVVFLQARGSGRVLGATSIPLAP